MKVNILGTDYEIIIGNEEDYPRLRQVDGCKVMYYIVFYSCKVSENTNAVAVFTAAVTQIIRFVSRLKRF